MKVALQKIYWQEIVNILKAQRSVVAYYSGQEHLVQRLNTIITEIERVMVEEEAKEEPK